MLQQCVCENRSMQIGWAPRHSLYPRCWVHQQGPLGVSWGGLELFSLADLDSFPTSAVEGLQKSQVWRRGLCRGRLGSGPQGQHMLQHHCRVLCVMTVSKKSPLLNPPGSATAAGVQGQQKQFCTGGLSGSGEESCCS